jgi:23S rRNA (cytosine1962-C5)-methyltransferase
MTAPSTATGGEAKDQVLVTPAGAARLLAGHHWLFRPQLVGGEPEDGAVVRVVDTRGRFLGMALHSARSAIALRLLTSEQRAIDETFIHERIAAARARRAPWLSGVAAYRLIHGEADGLPATVVDVYGEHLVVQTLSAGSERLLPLLATGLIETLAPASILLRNDPAVRLLEGLRREIRPLFGAPPSQLHLREGAVHLTADLRHGQKTGLFLDQRENRIAVEKLGGKRVLDCFTYQGGFALQAAARAEQVLAVDISRECLERVQENARLNGFDHIRPLEGNTFDVLRSLAISSQRFDLIILDPPAFAKNRAALEGALRGYKEINLRALKLLAPGGRLVTSSCSYHLSEVRFGMMLREAAADARRTVRVLARRGQGIDHPVLLGVPETSYLKCWVLEAE